VKALALTLLAACGGSGGFPDAPPPPSNVPGTFAVAWSLVDGNNQPITCAQANATSVNVGAVDEATSARFPSSFNCTLGDAASGALAAAIYDMDFSLLGGTSIIATAPAQLGVSIGANQTTQLTPIVFVVPGS